MHLFVFVSTKYIGDPYWLDKRNCDEFEGTAAIDVIGKSIKPFIWEHGACWDGEYSLKLPSECPE